MTNTGGMTQRQAAMARMQSGEQAKADKARCPSPRPIRRSEPRPLLFLLVPRLSKPPTRRLLARAFLRRPTSARGRAPTRCLRRWG